jgi:hypothetical protein
MRNFRGRSYIRAVAVAAIRPLGHTADPCVTASVLQLLGCQRVGEPLIGEDAGAPSTPPLPSVLPATPIMRSGCSAPSSTSFASR